MPKRNVCKRIGNFIADLEDSFHAYRVSQIRARIFRSTRPATAEEYLSFARRYAKRYGYANIHRHAGAIDLSHILIATQDLFVDALYGASAFSIIIPVGIHASHGHLGHNQLLIDEPEFAHVRKDMGPPYLQVPRGVKL